MEDYRELGSKYLSVNKKRSFITVVGCFIVAAGLFMFLNTLVCWVEKCRIDARKDEDYEIVILTDDKDIIEKVANEDFIASAYLGKVYSWNGESDDLIYANALHINVKEKLLINYYSKYITKTYGVETELNDLLSWTYCQDNDGIGYLMILFCLLIAFVLAIIGVGVLRNNISISAMERVKDYGNLRCIGATKKQIKKIVYRESVVLETIGIIAGIGAGFLLSIPVCTNPKRLYPVGFHILPVIFLLIAFYGDMYFAVGDGLKKVLAVSPSEAVRGTYRIKAKKIKRRRSGIWGLIFGVEGDYAYKNIKRNNGRFIKTVCAMVFGMIIVVVIGGWLGVFFKFYSEINSMYGYYQQYIIRWTDNVDSYEEHKIDLYSKEALEKIVKSNGISDPKYIYQSNLYTAEDRWVYKHIDKEYYTNTFDGKLYGNSGPIDDEEKREEREKKKQERKAYRDSGKGLVDYDNRQKYDENRKRYEINMDTYFDLTDTNMIICGYDEEDYKRLEDYLVDGTLDLSENGIVLVNYTETTPEDAYDDNTVLMEMEKFRFLDVKVGDEIKVVDPAALYELVQKERKNADAYDKTKEGDEEYAEIKHNHIKEAWIIDSAREKLVEEGKYKTYVIEGIVEKDPNNMTPSPRVIVPLDRFFEMTGKTESDYNGIRFHISNIFCRDFLKDDYMNAVYEKDILYHGAEESSAYYSETSPFLQGILIEVRTVKVVLEVVAVLFILIMISLLNTLNVTISGLQMRRNEFAQLRSLGMTKRSLLKAVLLEGGIVWIIATIIGIVLGIGIEYVTYITLMRLIINSSMYIFWPGIIIASILSLLVLAGSNYVFFKQMKLDVAGELIRSGE